MSLSISPYSSPEQQRQQAIDHIRLHLQDFYFRDTSYSYLPLPIIEHIATSANIHAVIVQDPILAADFAAHAIPSSPSHSHTFLTTKIFTRAKRCFASVLFASESMYFLKKLTNIVLDENLPIASATMEPELEDALEEFIAQQPIFCAPLMRMGGFEQCVAIAPFVRAEETGKTEEGRVVYEVEFHEGHVGEGERTGYYMIGFEGREDAEKSEVWGRRKMGFWWNREEKMEYFLCFE